ncbi:MAG: hypothetical protein HY739_07580 [Desulfobacterales bacterium]|nr:hypothetical protein [Desulfobacterales bacterium]
MSTKHIELTPQQREKVLRDIWVSHDARWFLKSIVELGFDTATKLNLAVIKSIGKTEIKQLVEEIGYGAIKDIEDFKALMEIATDLFFPEEHKYELEILDKDSFLGHVLECYIYKNVNKAGITDVHQCAAKMRFDSWLEAFGLEGETITEKNTNNCYGTCKIIFKIKW